MKIRMIAALFVMGTVTGACVLEGVSAGAVFGFIATHAARVGEAASVLQMAIEKYRASETGLEKVKVLAEVSCHFRTHHPEEMGYLREKLAEAGVSTEIANAARKLADEKCKKQAKVTENTL